MTTKTKATMKVTRTDDLITVRLRREEAEGIVDGLSDLLCWMAGYNAALPPDDYARRPMGIEETRRLSLKLRAALCEDDENRGAK